MTRYLMSAVVAGSLVGLPMFTGCDREVAKNETVEHKSDGTDIHKKDVTTMAPDGTKTTEQTKSVDKP